MKSRSLCLLPVLVVLGSANKNADDPVLVVDNTETAKPLVLRVEFKTDFKVNGKPAVAYPLNLLVVAPDGHEAFFSNADGTLKDGTARVSAPQRGTYRVYQSSVESLQASRKRVVEGEKVRFSLKTSHFGEGREAAFTVCRESSLCWDGDAASVIAQGRVALRGGVAVFEWAYAQPLGEDPGGGFMAIASLAGAEAMTPEAVHIDRFPLADVRGVRQLLKAQRYYRGNVLDADEKPFKAALVAFQSETKPCDHGIMPSGEFASDDPEKCHYLTCADGGLAAVPQGERGILGPVTRKMLTCIGDDHGWRNGK